MSTEMGSKINQLLSSQPAGIVLQSTWLREQGYSLDLQKRYRESKWLESIGSGAMKRLKDPVTYEGALYALQKQSGMSIHAGGKTALEMHGLAHYLIMDKPKIYVFGGKNERLTTWFKRYDWGVTIKYHATSFLPSELGLVEKEFKQFSFKISSPLRALMECLYLIPAEQDLVECFHFMESMNNLRPALVQNLLENCYSIKVKRLFLYLAEKAGHDWVGRLETEKIDLGKGKRSIIKKGVYNSKYQITVPPELENDDQRHI